MPFSKRSIDFDGVNDFCLVGGGSGVHDFDRTSLFSIVLWVRKVGAGAAYLVNKFANPGPMGWAVWASDTGFFIQLANNSTTDVQIQVGVTNPNDAGWHHVVVTWDGDVIGGAAGAQIYVDGVLGANRNVSSDTLAALSFSNVGSVEFGRLSTFGGLLLTGNLDDVGIYNKVLSAGEVDTIYNGGNPLDLRLVGPSTNLVGYWTMGDGDTFPILRDRQVATPILAAGTVKDRSSNSNDGTPTNMEDVDFTTDTPGGVSGYSATLDGVNEDVRFGDQAAHKFAHTDEFSCSVWVKYTSTGNDLIIGKGENAGNFRGWFIAQQATGAIAFVLRSVTPANLINVTTTATTFNDGAWHHVLVTWNGTVTQVAANAVIIVDGAIEPLTVVTDNLTSTIDTTAQFIIGSRTAVFFDGQVDEAALYDKALSLAEAQAVYNSGAPTDNTLLDTEPNLVGYWGIGEAANDATMTNMVAGDIEADAPQALFGGYLLDLDLFNSGSDFGGDLVAGTTWQITAVTNIISTQRFKMRGRDVTCPVGQQPAYVYWVVEDEPDEAALQATVGDLICGTDPLIDIVDIVVAMKWSE